MLLCRRWRAWAGPTSGLYDIELTEDTTEFLWERGYELATRGLAEMGAAPLGEGDVLCSEYERRVMGLDAPE